MINENKRAQTKAQTKHKKNKQKKEGEQKRNKYLIFNLNIYIIFI